MDAREEEVLHQTVQHEFNFFVNETLTLEKIVKATFLNPCRTKFERSCSPYGFYYMHTDVESEEAFLELVKTQIPTVMEEFDEKKIELFDVSRLEQRIDKIN